MIIKGNHKSCHSVLKSSALEKAIIKEIDHGWELPLTIESLQNIKNTGVVPLGGCRTILNKREGVKLYQKTRNTQLLITRTLRTFGKQPGPTGVTPTMLLWFLPDKYYTHDLCNTKQMANKTNPYW